MVAVTVVMIIVISLFTVGMILLKKYDKQDWEEINSAAYYSACYIPGGNYNHLMM